MKKARKVMKVLIILLIALIIVLVAIYINHRIQLNKEEALRTPLGKLVEVDGHQMSVYVEGNGDKTIVFLSGGGTCSPILDFKSLYATLSDDYRIVVVEKFGYGFSDVVDKERGIASILEDTRTALAKADVQGPYVLCPHSMSGIEALYWAQQYPEEVEAIVGLDMAVPGAYEDYKINMPMLKLSQFAARAGITRFLPGVAESDAIRYGTLSNTEKEIYFTSCGSESDNMAIRGILDADKSKNHLITTKVEHPCVLNLYKELYLSQQKSSKSLMLKPNDLNLILVRTPSNLV